MSGPGRAPRAETRGRPGPREVALAQQGLLQGHLRLEGGGGQGHSALTGLPGPREVLGGEGPEAQAHPGVGLLGVLHGGLLEGRQGLGLAVLAEEGQTNSCVPKAV